MIVIIKRPLKVALKVPLVPLVWFLMVNRNEIVMVMDVGDFRVTGVCHECSSQLSS